MRLRNFIKSLVMADSEGMSTPKYSLRLKSEHVRGMRKRASKASMSKEVSIIPSLPFTSPIKPRTSQ